MLPCPEAPAAALPRGGRALSTGGAERRGRPSKCLLLGETPSPERPAAAHVTPAGGREPFVCVTRSPKLRTRTSSDLKAQVCFLWKAGQWFSVMDCAQRWPCWVDLR